MRTLSLVALLIGIVLIPSALGVAKSDHDHRRAALERALEADADQNASALETAFSRASAISLLTANSPSFSRLLAEPGSRAQKLQRQGRNVSDVTQQLGYLERLYPSTIGKASLVDSRGDELARVVRGDIALPDKLSRDDERQPYFAATFGLAVDQVLQTRPYLSPSMHEWVLANSTLIPNTDGPRRALLEFEVSLDSFRHAISDDLSSGFRREVRVVDGRTGAVVIDAAHGQSDTGGLGDPGDERFAALARGARHDGSASVAGHLVAYRRVDSTVGNANDWVVVTRAVAPTGGVLSVSGPAPPAMLLVALGVIVLSGLWLRAGRRELVAQAVTDPLTGLGNRRKLMADLEGQARTPAHDSPVLVTMCDLNGFKSYNDLFGHPAGDALLARLGDALALAVEPFEGLAYRPGGDEFCVVARSHQRDAVEHAAARALSETGEGFAIMAAYGTALIPHDAADAAEALRHADEAMYIQKHSGRATAGRQSAAVLLRALAERHPDLGKHNDGVVDLTAGIGERLALNAIDSEQLRDAASLHDIGKVAIPDSIIQKPGPLTEEEWAFVRRHTIIGERILLAAPALGGAARLVRSTHEAWDGGGYPDGLAGDAIPLGSRVIAVCDAFDAMTADRPYAPSMSVENALAELRRCAGGQFDPAIVAHFERMLQDRASAPRTEAMPA